MQDLGKVPLVGSLVVVVVVLLYLALHNRQGMQSFTVVRDTGGRSMEDFSHVNNLNFEHTYYTES